MAHLQRTILIFFSLFLFQLLTSVHAQKQTTGHDSQTGTTDAAADDKDINNVQLQQNRAQDTLDPVQPQMLNENYVIEDEIEVPLDYDEVNELIKKYTRPEAPSDETDQPDDYMGEEIDQILDNGTPSQGLDASVSEYAPTHEPMASSMSATTTEAIGQAALSPNSTKVESSPTAPRPPLPQVTGCKTQGQIALTYSEGPSDVTAKIVRQLNKADARANFFVNATWLYTQQYAMVLQNIYNAGHLIGMTYRVKDDDPSALTDEDIRKDILNNAQIIEGLIGVSPKYVRLHYTENKDTRTEGIIRDLGFVLVGYNLDSQDYMKKDATGAGSIQEVYSETFKRYKDTYDAKGSFISIQYDLPYTGSLSAVSHIINTIDEEGYTMVRLDGCLNDNEPYKKSANSTEYIGDRFSFSRAGYHQGQKSITVDTVEEAQIEEDEFKIQGMESAAPSSKLVSSSVLLPIALAAYSLLL